MATSDTVGPTSGQIVPATDTIVLRSGEVVPASDTVVPLSGQVVPDTDKVVPRLGQVVPRSEAQKRSPPTSVSDGDDIAAECEEAMQDREETRTASKHRRSANSQACRLSSIL